MPTAELSDSPTLASKTDLPGFPKALSARLVARRLLTRNSQRERLKRSFDQFPRAGMTDYYFAATLAEGDPRRAFDCLRWGGEFVFVTHRIAEAERLLAMYRGRDDFLCDDRLTIFTGQRYDNRFLRLQRTYFYFTARKVLLTRIDEATDRHSYDVRLVPSPMGDDGWVVHKRVPSVQDAAVRLAARFPDLDAGVIEDAAAKLVDRIYPLFLTREAAFLKIVQRELPDAYRSRVPRCLSIEKDERGFVRELTMSWLRLGGDGIDQLTFARQAADLLAMLHDRLNVVHLDLRLDNYVVTPQGVGFVDFGSASRIGEDFSRSSILRSFFDEMLSSSQVQRDLRRMQSQGLLTSPVFDGCYHKIDKAVDLFYLLMEINRPLNHPDFGGLVAFDERSRHARLLAEFTRRIFRPADTIAPRFKCVRDVLDGLNLLE